MGSSSTTTAERTRRGISSVCVCLETGGRFLEPWSTASGFASESEHPSVGNPSFALGHETALLRNVLWAVL
eukprot:246291-Prymnesium_polylepis.1